MPSSNRRRCAGWPQRHPANRTLAARASEIDPIVRGTTTSGAAGGDHEQRQAVHDCRGEDKDFASSRPVRELSLMGEERCSDEERVEHVLKQRRPTQVGDELGSLTQPTYRRAWDHARPEVERGAKEQSMLQDMESRYPQGQVIYVRDGARARGSL